jgi:hypothetical protein
MEAVALSRGNAIVSWDFETDPEYRDELDWVDDFVRNEVEPVDQTSRAGLCRSTARSA